MGMEYDDIVAVIALIDAASNKLFDADGAWTDAYSSLISAHNELNQLRLSTLGNGQDRPFTVEEALSSPKATQ